MLKGLIPKVRVNYSWKDLFFSLFVNSKSHKYLNKCESFISDYFGGKSVLLTPSGRDALYELLVTLPQTKVIIPAYTCPAVYEASVLANKKVVFSGETNSLFNSSFDDCCIDNDSIIIATHQYGVPCNIEQIKSRCKENGAVLVEDCAAAIGSIVNKQNVGSFGDFAFFSFNASKTITVPPYGGALITNNTTILDIIRERSLLKDSNCSFRIYGMLRGGAFVLLKNKVLYRLFSYFIKNDKLKILSVSDFRQSFLYRYRFSEWQAFILYRQLCKVEKLFKIRQDLFSYYDKYINNNAIIKPVLVKNSVCCRYTIQVKDRESFFKYCNRLGLDLDYSHRFLMCPDSYVYELCVANSIVNLPMYSEISSKERVRVVEIVNSYTKL